MSMYSFERPSFENFSFEDLEKHKNLAVSFYHSNFKLSEKLGPVYCVGMIALMGGITSLCDAGMSPLAGILLVIGGGSFFHATNNSKIRKGYQEDINAIEKEIQRRERLGIFRSHAS